MASEEGYALVPQEETYPPLAAKGADVEDDWHVVVPDLTSSRKPSTAQPSRRSRLLAVVGILLAFLIGSAVGACVAGSDNRATSQFWRPFWPTRFTGTSTPPPSGNILCADAYNQPGYIWRGQSDTQIRWIPYSDAPPDAFRLNNVTIPPPEALVLAPRSYNALLSEAQDLVQTPAELDFMRGRTVIFVGDSHDRKNVEGFCALHKPQGAQLVVRGGHLSSRCKIPALNFTLTAWFLYGLAEADEEWYAAELEQGGDRPPAAFEQRLAVEFEPELATTGDKAPDLIVLNSVYWDLLYLSRKARHERWSSSLPSWAGASAGAGEWSLQDPVRALSWNELRWHRHRLGMMVQLFRDRFPGVPLMYRTAQSRANNRAKGNVALFQINDSAKFIMHQLGVPIFPWGDLLVGSDDYGDDIHFKVPSQATYLCADMALYYLERVVTRDWQIGRSPVDDVCG
ncbi:hypothetical protein JCM3774_001661 [Rhodotorula dairenensis]